MKILSFLIAAFVGGIIGGATVAQVMAANQQGLIPVGTLLNGQCLQVQATGPTNGVVGITCPQSQPPFGVGTVVAGATPNMMLGTDVNNKVTLYNGLTAN